MKNRVDAGDHLVKTAIIHDWLINRAEEEQSLESLCTLFPDADVYTLFYKPEAIYLFSLSKNWCKCISPKNVKSYF